MSPPARIRRTPLGGFPDVLLHADEAALKRHPNYAAARGGDLAAARSLVRDTLDVVQVAVLQRLARGQPPTLVAVHGPRSRNVIAQALAAELGQRLGWPVDSAIVQANAVAHDGADGFGRLARPARFDGPVQVGRDYVLVDDMVGMGGTLANLRGHIEGRGGWVLAAVALSGRPQSARLAQAAATLAELRERHGEALEAWWHERHGHGFDALTESEARFLVRTPTADVVRERLAAAEG